MCKFLCAATAACLAVLAMPAYAVILLGPGGGSGLSGEYSQAADSPFAAIDFSGGYFHLENFEGLNHAVGQQFNTPGVSGNNGGPVTQTFGLSIHDSVDLDDGVLDGSGLNGESWFSSVGATGVTFTFDASVLGMLPTHAGIVWTDGGNPITFEAFAADGTSLGTVVGNHATAGVSGETNSDRFYGAIESGGISAVKLSNLGGGIELDHLQYGKFVGNAVPEPPSLILVCLGLAAIAWRRRHVR